MTPTSQEALYFPSGVDAIILGMPGASPVTVPSATEAALLLSEDQTREALSAGRFKKTLREAVSPGQRRTDSQSNVMPSGGSEILTVHASVNPPSTVSTVIEAFPSETPVTIPESMDTTDSS